MSHAADIEDEDLLEKRAMDHPVRKRFNPAAVAEAMEDPAVFEQVARGDLYIQLHHLRQLAASPSFPVGQRMEYAKFLAKMGKVEKPDDTAHPLAGMPGITIVLPNSGQSTQLGADRPTSQMQDINELPTYNPAASDEDEWGTGS